MESVLQTAVEAAHRAGCVIVERHPRERRVMSKGYRDLVTDTDTAAENEVLSLIRSRHPQHAILSEEAGGAGIGAGPLWIVDPLDGTTNFAHRLPLFSVSVGFLVDGEPVVGVVHDPLRGQTFSAVRGDGAWLDGQRLWASDIADLGQALVSFDWGHADAIRQRSIGALNRIGPRCGTIRGLGSAVLALAYVAAGWLDAYFNLDLKPWDTAAATLLVTEAGGACRGLSGQPYHVGEPACLATNGHLGPGLVEFLREPSLEYPSDD